MSRTTSGNSFVRISHHPITTAQQSERGYLSHSPLPSRPEREEHPWQSSDSNPVVNAVSSRMARTMFTYRAPSIVANKRIKTRPNISRWRDSQTLSQIGYLWKRCEEALLPGRSLEARPTWRRCRWSSVACTLRTRQRQRRPGDQCKPIFCSLKRRRKSPLRKA